jgi:hypothetical protein
MANKHVYTTTALRELLYEAFSSETFGIFCKDYFAPVTRHFAPNMDHTLRVDTLIDYCKRQGKMEELLERIKQENEYQYHCFIDAIRSPLDTAHVPQDEGMDEERMAEIAQVQTTLRQTRRALLTMQEQVAGYGGRTYAPSHILMSMEDNERQIRQLEQRLHQLQRTSPTSPTNPLPDPPLP